MTRQEIHKYCWEAFNPGQFFINDDLSVDIRYLDTRHHDIQNFPFKIGKVTEIRTNIDLELLPINIYHLKSVICPEEMKETSSTYKRWKLYRNLLTVNNTINDDPVNPDDDEIDWGDHQSYDRNNEPEDLDLSEIHLSENQT